jgi:hypothetical protein
MQAFFMEKRAQIHQISKTNKIQITRFYDKF